MKFVNFIQGQKPNLGVLNSSGKIVSFDDLGIETNDMNEFIIHFDKFKHKLTDLDSKIAYEIPQENYLAPIIEPRQDIICLGINFFRSCQRICQI